MLQEKLLKVCKKFSFQNFKDFNFKKYFKFFSLFLLLIIFGLVLPRGFVQADLAGIILDHTIFPVLYIVFAILLWVGFIITSIAAYTLNATLNPAIMNQVFANPAIYQGWTIIRDICNLLFLLILLLVAFGTIVQSDRYNIKKSLPKLILAIFLINFSNVIAGVIIDFGNILMYGILGWMCAVPDSCFSDYMGGLMKVAWNFADTYSLLKLLSWDGINSTQVIGAAVAMVYLFMYGFILLALAAFLMVRTAGLALLLILAPFAYFGEVMPGMEKIASKWWNNIWSYALFGPIFALMLYIAGELAQITIAVPPITDPNLGWYSGTIVIIISNILPLLFLLAIIPVTKELGLAGTDVIMKNTTGLGQNIGKFAVGAAGDTWGRYAARGAGMQAKKGDSLLRRAYIKARNVGSIASPTAWKDAYKAKKSIDAHDYDAARGRIQDKTGWKSKYVESEQDRVTDAETHKAFGEMGIKGKDEMVYALKTAVKEGNGPMVAEIMRALAVNGDTDAGTDALNEEKFGAKSHTAEDYNKVMNEVIKPLLNAEKTAKLSNEIGKSEEKNNNFIYGGHDSYDPATNKYSMKDMANGSEADKAEAKKDQQDFMIGRWNSKDEFSRIGTVGKTNFEGKDAKNDPSEEGAMFLGQLKGAEALKQVKRFKPKVATFIAEKYAAAFAQWKTDGKKEGTIFANMKDEDIDTAAKIHKRIVEIREGKYKDYSDENEEGEEEGSSGGKGKKGGDGGGYAGGSAYTGGGGYTYSASGDAGGGKKGGKKSGGGGGPKPVSGGSVSKEDFVKGTFADIRTEAKNIKSRSDLDKLHSKFTEAIDLTDVSEELKDVKKEEVKKTLEAIREADKALGEEIKQVTNKSGGADLDSGRVSREILKESEKNFDEAFEEVKPYNPTLPNYYKNQSGSLGNFAAKLKEEKADDEIIKFVNEAVAKNRSTMANNLRQNDMAQVHNSTPKSFGNKDMGKHSEVDLNKYVSRIKQGNFTTSGFSKKFGKVDKMIGEVGGSAGHMFGAEYEKARSLYDYAVKSKNPKEQQAYLAMTEHTLDSIENGLGDKEIKKIVEKGLI